MDMRFGTWNIGSFYRLGSLRTVARELVKYELDLMGVRTGASLIVTPDAPAPSYEQINFLKASSQLLT
jgi:hypothetical protein